MSKGADIDNARPRAIAALAVHFRDLDIAEDAFADAASAYLEKGISADNPAAWLITAGKRKGLDAMRKRNAEERAADGLALVRDMTEIITFPEPIQDERLRLIFICCHPAIALEARVALALKVICGLPVAEIARVFVTSEQTMYQRITRAKTKVRDAGIAFELPARKEWGERLDAVLLTLELAYTVAYQDAAGERDDGLSAEVARLAAMLAELLPDEAEALGLAALVGLARARENARVDGDGAMVPVSQQDTTKWNIAAIEQAGNWLDQAAQKRAPGPYQVMATIQLTHARRAFDGQVDALAIARLYDALVALRPGPMVALNRAVAIGTAYGAQRGFAELELIEQDASIVEKLEHARPYHVARGDLLAKLDRKAEAAEALERALKLDPPSAERLFLQRKRDALLG